MGRHAVLSTSEWVVEQAIAEGYRDLAAAIALEGVEELKTNSPPAGPRDMPAFEFLLSEWGCYLADAGAHIPPSVMRKMARGYEADTHRFYCYGGDALGMVCALEPALEEEYEKELYRDWTHSKAEDRRYKAVLRERKRERRRKELARALIGIIETLELVLMEVSDG